MAASPGSPPRAILAALQAKKWWGFDLDDTLHSFRSASRKAVAATLTLAYEKHGIPLATLEAAYFTIFRGAAATGFVDGRTSHEYRHERFAGTLSHFGVEDKCLVDEMVTLYGSVLIAALELKPGAKEIMSWVKLHGKKAVIVTEGPEDGQRQIIEALGFSPDHVYTSNKCRVGKVDGLFQVVLDDLQVDAADVVFVGDSWERDIQPASALGIDTVYVRKAEKISLEGFPLRIDSLVTLLAMVEGK